MKKFLIILVCFVIAFSTFAVPSLAAKSQSERFYYEVIGFNFTQNSDVMLDFYSVAEVNKYSRPDGANVYSIDLPVLLNGIYYDILYYTTDGKFRFAQVDDNNRIIASQHIGYHTGIYEGYRDFFVTNYISERIHTFLWFYSERLISDVTMCNGSTCNIQDYNIDSHCDTCGNPIAFSVRADYTPAGYPSNLPALPIGFDNTSQYVIFKVGSKTNLYTFSEDYGTVSYWVTSHDNNLLAVRTLDANKMAMNTVRRSYELVNGEWIHTNTSDQNISRFVKPSEAEFIYSTLTFYNEDGTVFFPIPLWEQVRQVYQRATLTEVGTLGVTVAEILTIALGGLALLVALPLLVILLKNYLRKSGAFS